MSFRDLENFEKKLQKDIESGKAQTKEYANNVDKLYAEVRQWVKPLEKSGKLKLNQVDETLSELDVTDYHLNALELIAGKKLAFLNPKGVSAKASITHKGVVNLEGEGGSPSFTIALAPNGTWKVESEKGQFEELNEQQFTALLKKVVPIK
ncbi:hypothetical protein [Vibrio nitrifigilis]|uniref:Uncharacterized protein n=1 Tax=Vibrio nitrifigilis TaxID=2789781 RepID=A0ABS0GDJ4_9VIBR|nr:hypothetical protein [Vibrio nitrifigilis]MBF9000480.1 hypothetical protein [Vibrio nitrifigilis]